MKLRRVIEILGLSLISIVVGCGGQSIEPESTAVQSIPIVDTTLPVLTTTTLSLTTSVAVSQQSMVGVYFMKNELISVTGRLVGTPDINEALRICC